MSPGNEEWANHWFMALARIGDWKLLQQVLYWFIDCLTQNRQPLKLIRHLKNQNIIFG